MNRTRLLSRFGVIVALASGLALATQTAASADPPTFTVAPSTGLADGQVVTGSVTGAGANEGYGALQCASVADTFACNAATAVEFTTDATGAAEFPYTVARTFDGVVAPWLPGGGTPWGPVDCDASPCFIAAGNGTLNLGNAPISFG